MAAWSFYFGAVIASFLNVVIWRVPRGESVVRPPSHCPKCGASIKWYQNLPIFSYLALRGRCANCGGKISSRYLWVELLGGCLFCAAWLKFGLDAPFWWVWLSLMLVLPLCFGQAPWWSLLDCVIGIVAGLSIMGLIRFLGGRAFKREAMGMGDVLLMGAVGSMTGWPGVLFALVVSSFLGSLGGLAAMALSRKWGRNFEIPYGPYICLANAIYLFFPQTMDWYLRLFR